jgi:transposase-like protein
MAGTLTRTTRVPHTDKRPERCPHCGSTHVTRKGTRKKKIEIVQLWRCASCKSVFTPAPAALRHKTVARQSGWEDSDNQDENPGVAA